jgi:hypothetical protein
MRGRAHLQLRPRCAVRLAPRGLRDAGLDTERDDGHLFPVDEADGHPHNRSHQ